jgi:protein kinase A
MPTLGFLKKKRTKDSSGSKDLDSPTSPIKDAFSPITPTSSKNTRASIASKSSATNPPQAASQSTTASTAPSHKPADSMNSSYPQQAYATPQASPEPYQQASSHNVASIQNLIHPSNNANANAYQQQKPANGAATPSQPASQPRQTKGKYTLGDFQIQRTLGTGSFGRVHLVQSKHNQRFYAVKVLKKAQVVKMKQVEHTNDERRMLQQVKHPFLITLWGTFQDSKNLYMVMDFVEGGELFSLLRKSQVSLRLVYCLSLLTNVAIS